jgi:hypothetical protein
MSEPEAVYLTAEEIAHLLEEPNVLLIKRAIRVTLLLDSGVLAD